MAEKALIRPAVFLAAGVPYDPGRGPYMETADPVAIRDAVRALVAVVLERGLTLVFGGQPAITSLVAQIGTSLGKLDSVIIYQSKWFREVTPKEVDWFGNLRWTERKDTLAASLVEMRTKMFTADDLRYNAAVFIGGMNGVEDEQKLITEFQPYARQFAVASTGGGALNLWNDVPLTRAEFRRELMEELQYQYLFEEILSRTNRF